jgi:hypothetical protein
MRMYRIPPEASQTEVFGGGKGGTIHAACYNRSSPDPWGHSINDQHGRLEMPDRTKRRPYKAPTVQDWGSVTDLTSTGTTNPGGDAKGGSVSSQGE